MAVCGVTPDHNAFYVCMSLALFKRHDQHQQIRRRVWNRVARAVFRLPLDEVVPGSKQRARVPSSKRHAQWIACWRRWAELHRPTELNTAVVTCSLEGSPVPLDLTASVCAVVYGVTIRIHVHATGRCVSYPDGDDSQRHCVHLLSRDGILSLLVPASRSDARIQMRGGVCVSFADPVDASAVPSRGAYRLDMFDRRDRRHHVIGSFWPPARPDCHVHVMHIDARLVRPDRAAVFTVEGCQAEGKPVYIFAISPSAEGAGRRAIRIGLWDMDYVSPVVAIRTYDEMIAVVPAPSPADAADMVTRECQCSVLYNRPEESSHLAISTL